MAYEDDYSNRIVATTDDWSQSPWINNFAVQGALTGLQYLGDTLSKPKNALFGAVGGLLDGDPLEAVKQLGNLIPFSDTMGLTNTKGGLLTEKSTGGYDLLKKTGLVDDQTTGGGAAGFALDLLADPANWLTFGAGAVTKAGRAAELAGKLEPTLLGRIKTGQGGIMGIANKPWYAELLGGAPAENIAVLGMGKGGEAFASGLDKGVSAATRFTIPGTDFAPIGALRAAFSKGSGNTGYGPIVDEFGGGFGKTNVNRIEGEMATASRRNAFPAMDYQSEAINELLATGMAEEAIPAALNRAAVTHHELGRMKMAQNLTPQQEQIVSNYAQKFSAHMGPHLQAEKDAYRALGGQLEDTSNIWGHRYLNRAQAEMGNAAGTAMKQRTPFINDLPGGQDMFEQWAINPQFSGIATRKVAGQAYDGVAIQAAVKQNASDMAQEIMAEAQQQLAVMQQQGLKVPQRALDIAANANGAADNLANEAANYIAKLDPKVVDRGMFYRQDLGSNALAYGANMAKQKAVNTGALNVLAKEGKDIDSMLMKATNTNDVVSLKQAIEELQMAGAEQTLMTKIPGMASVDDLASRGVSRKLVDKLKQEVNPGDAAGENFIDKLSSAFRYGVTIPFPANFFRNWTGELANTAVAGQNPVRGLGNTMKFYNQTLDDPLARAAASATEREGLITGVLGTDQVRAMLGTGTHNGERMLNYNPTPSMRTTGEIARDWAKPITSAAKRAEMEITPLKELAGVPSGQPPSSIGGKAVALLGDNVVDPARGYMAAMETAHAFQNKATRHQALQALMDQGYTAEGAAKRVLTTQRNYENLSDFERKYMRNLVPFWNFCVPVSHEVLTREGWKTCDQCVVGEEIMAYNHETQELAWQRMDAINVFDFNGDLLKIERRGGLKFLFTDNHRWPVVVEGCTVSNGTSDKKYYYPQQRQFVLGHQLRGHHNIPRIGNFRGDGTSILSPRLASILGWLVTDGYHRWRGNYCEMMVYQHPKKYLKNIQELLGTGARSRKPHPDTGVICTPIDNNDAKEITKFFKSKKDLLWIVPRLSREAAECMWECMFQAEGSFSRGKKHQFSQSPHVNKYVLEAFQILSLMTGKNMAIRDSLTHYIKSTTNLNISKRPDKEHYAGKIWCPTTRWGTWVMRHNGHVIITGNSKQNAISQADMIARNPGRYNTMLQAVNSGRADDSFVPSWASSGTAIPIPGAAEGQQRFIGNLGLPVEDEAIGALGALLSGSPGEAVRRAASSSNPILKTIYETATGRQVFSGRDLEDLKPSPVVSALLGDNKFSRGLTQAVTGTPMSRSLSTVDRLVNSPEKGVLSTLLNLGTGIRTVDVDQDQAAGIAARQQIERLMMESGQFKKRENLFLKPELRDQKDQLPPEVQELMQYHQALLKKAQDAAKLKALADSPR